MVTRHTPPLLLAATLILACNNTSYLPTVYGEVPISLAATPQGPVLYTAQLEIKPNVIHKETLRIRKGDTFEDSGLAFVAPQEGTILSASKLSGETYLLYAPEGDENFRLAVLEQQKDWNLDRYHDLLSVPKLEAWQSHDAMVLSFSEFLAQGDGGVPLYRFAGGKLVETLEATAVSCSALGCFSLVVAGGSATLRDVTAGTAPLAVTTAYANVGFPSFTCADPSDAGRFTAIIENTRFSVDVTAPSITVSKLSPDFLTLVSRGGLAHVECIDAENVLLFQEDGKARIVNLQTATYEVLPIAFDSSPGSVGAVGYVEPDRILIAYAAATTKEYGCGAGVTCRQATYKTKVSAVQRGSHAITAILE